jgi:hypothetical protein
MVALERRVGDVLSSMGVSPAGAPGPIASGTSSMGTFRREGEYWSIVFEGDKFRLRDSKGLRYLSVLLVAPGREIHVLELVSAVEAHGLENRTAVGNLPIGSDAVGPILDERAKTEYRIRLRELETELAEAEAWNDPARTSRLRDERDFLVRELASALGLGGRDRKAASNAERARVNVTRAIRAALDRIAEHSPELGRHLSITVRTGAFCSYQRDPLSPISWTG